MRLVRQVPAPADGPGGDQEPPVFLLHAVARHLVRFVARLTLAGAAMEAVLVPRANHHLAFERSPAQRPADVIADIGDDAELSVLERDSDKPVAHLRLAQRR